MSRSGDLTRVGSLARVVPKLGAPNALYDTLTFVKRRLCARTLLSGKLEAADPSAATVSDCDVRSEKRNRNSFSRIMHLKIGKSNANVIRRNQISRYAIPSFSKKFSFCQLYAKSTRSINKPFDVEINRKSDNGISSRPYIRVPRYENSAPAAFRDVLYHFRNEINAIQGAIDNKSYSPGK